MKKVWTLALATTLYAAPLSAEDPNAGFIPEDQCLAKSKPCTCMDLQSMRDFRQNQKDALDAWDQTARDIATGTSGAKTAADARTIFGMHFMSATEAKVASKFQTCPGYDMAKDSPKRVAGVSGITPVLSPCFCSAFCQDIVKSTVTHEKTHVKVNVGVLGLYIDVLIACKVGIVSAGTCDMVEPMTLAASEIAAHTAGIEEIDAAIKKLEAASTPDCMSPTILPLVPPDPAPPRHPPPAGFGERVRLLLGRIARGAGG
jgi:hypothetical protein